MRQKSYDEFLQKKMQAGGKYGFTPHFLPDFLFDFQSALVTWAVEKGKAAMFADCGMGKTIMELVWATNVLEKTQKPVLILTPFSVSFQVAKEAEKFGLQGQVSRDGSVYPITISNYERLHYFNAADFSGVVCDESSCIKHFTGATQKAVTRFMAKTPYRLLCTATPSPNDYHELGTSSEALGELGYSDMLTRFFVMDDKKRTLINDVKLARGANSGNHFAKLAYRVAQQISQWRMKAHAEEFFWQWICSWARACRMPEDLGFDDGAFVLPPLNERHHLVHANTPGEGMLFQLPAFGLKEERDERKRTITERCTLAANLVDHNGLAVVWCHLNSEGDTLESLIPYSIQVQGADDEDYRVAVTEWFLGQRCLCDDRRFAHRVKAWEATQGCHCGSLSGHRVLISKPSIFGWGLNLQACNHVVTFVSHSYEAYYQSIRRCWRFGQTKPVTVDIISTKGEEHVKDNMLRKAVAAREMFQKIVGYMNQSREISTKKSTKAMEAPSWL